MDVLAHVLIVLAVSIVTLVGILRLWGHDMLRSERYALVVTWIALTLGTLLVVINV